MGRTTFRLSANYMKRRAPVCLVLAELPTAHDVGASHPMSNDPDGRTNGGPQGVKVAQSCNEAHTEVGGHQVQSDTPPLLGYSTFLRLLSPTIYLLTSNGKLERHSDELISFTVSSPNTNNKIDNENGRDQEEARTSHLKLSGRSQCRLRREHPSDPALSRRRDGDRNRRCRKGCGGGTCITSHPQPVNMIPATSNPKRTISTQSI